MKTIMKISLVVLAGSSILTADEMMKRYDVKSGKVEYSIQSSGEFLGVSIKTIGKKKVIFDDYGVKDLTEVNKVEKRSINGKADVTKTHTIDYVNNAILYSVSFDEQKIMRTKNPAMTLGALFGGGHNMKQTGESLIKAMGGKKVGTDKILGYDCAVWDIMGSKQCIYKGIALKVETNILGMKNIELATKAEFDISMKRSDFGLPNFPIYNERQEKLDMSSAQLDAMDANESKRASQDSANTVATIQAAMQALQQNGSDSSTPESITPKQEESMGDTMMSAMLPQMKKEIIEQEGIMTFARDCIQSASSLSEANECNRQVEKKLGEEIDKNDDIKVWNDQEKSKILAEINEGLKSVQCVKDASTVKDIKGCLSEF